MIEPQPPTAAERPRSSAPLSRPRLSATARRVARYGPWAVVTGASDGIGRAFAEQLAAAGISVVLVARRAAVLGELAADLELRHGVETRVVALDLARASAPADLARATAELDVGLLVAAGGFGSSGPLLERSAADELEMVDVNCRAVLALAHHFGGRFVARGSGGVVLLSSIVAFQGVPGSATYAATKAFVQSLAEGLGAELGGSGVDVVACAPGPVRSGFGARAGLAPGSTDDPAVVAAGTLAALGRRRLVRPGWHSKLLGWSLMTLPRWGRVALLGRIMAGMRSR